MARGLNRWACALAAVILLGLAVPHRGEGWAKVWGIEDPYDNVKSLYFSHVPPYPPLLAWGTEQGPPVDGDNRGRAYVSTDLLETYRELPLIPYADPGVLGTKYVTDYTVNPDNGARLMAGTNNWGVFSIDLDFRETWEKNLAFPRQANAMASGYDGANLAYWAGFQQEGVYKSSNAGQTWYQTLADQYVNDLDYDSETKTLYAATLNGVRVSEDGGESWVRHSLTGKVVYSVAMDPHAPRTVWAGTQTYGVFRSTDGGATWEQASEGLPQIGTGVYARM